MPRNRRAVDTEAKRRELVAAATELFVADGYDATPIGAIAKRAGVAINTVYWYFADKEQLLVAVLDTLVEETWHAYGGVADQPAADRLAWVVLQLQQLSQLVATVHARVEHSPHVRAWHDGFHAAVRHHLRGEIEALGVGPARLDAEADIVVLTVEGLITHRYDQAGVQAICEAIAEHWRTVPIDRSDETPPSLTRRTVP